MSSKTQTAEGLVAEYVTAVIGGQLFGLPISRVQDVFMPERLTRVPLSSQEIAGVLNLRGRIVTVVDMRARLGLPEDSKEENPVNLDPRMAKLAGGVHRLDGQLMVVLDVDRVLELTTKAITLAA
jgi:purine-binding chemotaxis protein CheW